MQLSKAIRVEMLEHPWAGKRIAARIAKDHARKNPDYGSSECPVCGGEAQWLGGLSNITYYRCRDCGAQSDNRPAPAPKRHQKLNLQEFYERRRRKAALKAAMKKKNPSTTPVKKRKYPPTSVLFNAANYYGEFLGAFYRPHNGTIADIRKQAEVLQRQVTDAIGWGGERDPGGLYNVNCQMGATDAQGRPAWAISPNLKHISRAGTREARYTLGDLSARPNMTRDSPNEMMMEWARKRFGRDLGLTADWAVSAFLVKGRNFKNAVYLVDNEDDTWSVVQRVWGIPDEDESVFTELFTGTASAIRKKLCRGKL